MTTFACGEVLAAEGAFAIMTSHAALRFSSRVMIERLGSCHLPALRLASADLMTFVASNLLVLCVIEADAEGRHHLRRARVTTQLMTGAARRNVAAARLRARRVTTIAGRVRIEAGRNRHRYAAARFAMTRRTTHAAHTQVSRMIEFHPKTLQPRKRFQCSRLHVGMTDGADRTFRI